MVMDVSGEKKKEKRLDNFSSSFIFHGQFFYLLCGHEYNKRCKREIVPASMRAQREVAQ
jgi:hypothetical protein